MKKNFKIHFIGIGGVSMSAIAKFFVGLGFCVSGSDIVKSDTIFELEKLGVKITQGHFKENVLGKDLVIFNNAIKNDNPEIIQALESKILVFSRTEILKEIIKHFNLSVGVSGCHGKTTATCMIANMVKGNFKGFIHIGGNDKNLSNYYFDGKELLLTEVCEYAKNINNFTCDIAVCLNIGYDHHDSYKNFNELIMMYYAFLDRADTKIINNDDIYLNNYNSNNVITFGINRKADYSAKNIRIKKGKIYFDLYNHFQKIQEFKISGYCYHNVYNALATICVGKVLGLTYEEIKKGLMKYSGVERRMEYLGKKKRQCYYADYAHHPEELTSTIKSIEKVFGLKNTLIVFQPHTYSRTKNLISEFKNALLGLNLIIYKTYPAREVESQGYSAEKLSKILNVDYCDNKLELLDKIKNSHKKTVFFMGAGDIYYIGKEIIKSLY